MAENFALLPDLTRWGAHEGGLDDNAWQFIHQHIGQASPRTEISWEDLSVPETRLSAADLAQLHELVGAAQVSTEAEARRQHAGGLSYLDLVARRQDALRVPDAVVTVQEESDIVALLQWCANAAVAVIPFGGGTSVVGGVRAGTEFRATVCLDLHLFCDVLDLDAESHLVTVGAGMTGPQLERYLNARGLTLGHYPQSWQRASIGGYAATRSAGQASTGYGRSDEMIEGLRIATPRGVLNLGIVAASAAGPDLRQLFIGSEGAFGVITAVTLRVRRFPAAQHYGAVIFRDFASGVAAFQDLYHSGAAADVMRLSDAGETATTLALNGPKGKAAEIFEKYLAARKITQPALAILGFEGNRGTVAARRLEAATILRSHHAVSLGAKVGQTWHAHRFAGPYLRDQLLDAGYLVETLETAVRWSSVTTVHREVGQVLTANLQRGDQRPYVMCHISHVYQTSASLYFTVITPQDQEPVAQWQQAKHAVMDTLVANQATITHHHAVGRDHQPWLAAEISDLGVEILRSVKNYLDPAGVLNPGVLIGTTD